MVRTLLFSMTLPAPTDRSPAPLPLGTLRAVTPATGYHYLVSVPAGVASRGPAGYPLVIFLHGVSERGTDVREVARQGLPKLLTGRPELTPQEAEVGALLARAFVVAAPQCARDEVWDETRLLGLLDDLQRDYPVDPARVYLTGLSMGGFGVWSLGIRHARRFAALVPVCGGGRVKDVAVAAQDPAALRQLGIWAFHGARDRVVPLEESQRMIEATKRAGVRDVQFTVYADGEHDAWTRAYADPELYAWLLRHARAPIGH
jgi:predicted peptidase